MNPLFISKSSGSSIKCWFNGSEDLSPNTMVWISSNDRVSDISPSQWLDRFIKATAVRNRTKRDENRILIPNSHGSHLPLEILQKRKDHMTVLFELLDNFTHICQPLDCKSFLSYKQHFLGPNHEISYQVDKPMGKAEFLRMIRPVRSKVFKQRIICESFKECGIYPVDGSKILSKLSNRYQYSIPELIASYPCSYGCRTPPPASLPSSGIKKSPLESIKAVQKDYGNIFKLADFLLPELQRNIDRTFRHHQDLIDQLATAKDTIMRMISAQQPMNSSNPNQQI